MTNHTRLELATTMLAPLLNRTSLDESILTYVGVAIIFCSPASGGTGEQELIVRSVAGPTAALLGCEPERLLGLPLPALNRWLRGIELAAAARTLVSGETVVRARVQAEGGAQTPSLLEVQLLREAGGVAVALRSVEPDGSSARRTAGPCAAETVDASPAGVAEREGRSARVLMIRHREEEPQASKADLSLAAATVPSPSRHPIAPVDDRAFEPPACDGRSAGSTTPDHDVAPGSQGDAVRDGPGDRSTSISEEMTKMMRNAPAGLYRFALGPTGRQWLPYMSPGLCDLLGLPEANSLSSLDPIVERIHPSDRASFVESIARALSEGSVWRRVFRVTHPERGERWLDAVATPHHGEADATVAYYGYVFDATATIIARREAERIRRQLVSVTQNLPAAAFKLRLRGRGLAMAFCAPQVEALFGVSPDEALKDVRALLRAVHAEDVKPLTESIARALERGEAWRHVWRVERRDGVRWVEGQARFERSPGEEDAWYGFFNDITDLMEARRRAEASSAAKSAFLATMSHEIRTPLNGVLGMAELLSHTELTERQGEMLGIVRESGRLLLATLNNVLDYSRLEDGRLSLEAAPFDPAAVASRVAALFRPCAAQRGVDLVVRTDPAIGKLVGDEHRVEQVLNNLVGNAVKFTETGEIAIEIERGEGELVAITVRDTGIGMTPEQLATAFDSFTQGDASTTRKYGGSGLGLTIVQGLVELMGGEIRLESKAGSGLTARVRAPLPPA